MIFITSRATALVALAAATTLALTACTGASSGDTAPSNDLVVVRGEDTATLDPAAGITPADIATSNQLYDRLFQLAADGESIEPSLAESSEASADGLTWTIRLKPGVTFSNGDALTSADVVYSLTRSRDANQGFSFLLGTLAEVTAVDEQTLTITTAEPSATLLPALSSWVASILPEDLLGQSEEEFFENPVGSGPFVLGDWNRGQSIELERNPGYWQEGLPHIDSVTWNVVPDPNTRVSQVQGGLADASMDIPQNRISTLAESDGLDATSFPSNFTTFLIFNQAFEPFDDVHVRRAISMAIDRDALSETTLFGTGEAACSMLPPSMPFAATPDCLQYDVAAAQEEIAKSKTPDGFTVEFTIDNLPTSTATAQFVQAALEPLGIEATIKTVDSGQLYTIYDQSAYQLGLAAWASDLPDPDAQLSFMLDPTAGGNAYYTGYDNPRVNELIAEGRREIDSDRRAEIYAEIQQIVAQELPHLPLSHMGAPWLWSTDLEGFAVNPMGTIDLLNVKKTAA